MQAAAIQVLEAPPPIERRRLFLLAAYAEAPGGIGRQCQRNAVVVLEAGVVRDAAVEQPRIRQLVLCPAGDVPGILEVQPSGQPDGIIRVDPDIHLPELRPLLPTEAAQYSPTWVDLPIEARVHALGNRDAEVNVGIQQPARSEQRANPGADAIPLRLRAEIQIDGRVVRNAEARAAVHFVEQPHVGTEAPSIVVERKAAIRTNDVVDGHFILEFAVHRIEARAHG